MKPHFLITVVTLATGMMLAHWVIDVAWGARQAAREAAKKAAEVLKEQE